MPFIENLVGHFMHYYEFIILIHYIKQHQIKYNLIIKQACQPQLDILLL